MSFLDGILQAAATATNEIGANNKYNRGLRQQDQHFQQAMAFDRAQLGFSNEQAKAAHELNVSNSTATNTLNRDIHNQSVINDTATIEANRLISQSTANLNESTARYKDSQTAENAERLRVAQRTSSQAALLETSLSLRQQLNQHGGDVAALSANPAVGHELATRLNNDPSMLANLQANLQAGDLQGGRIIFDEEAMAFAIVGQNANGETVAMTANRGRLADGDPGVTIPLERALRGIIETTAGNAAAIKASLGENGTEVVAGQGVTTSELFEQARVETPGYNQETARANGDVNAPANPEPEELSPEDMRKAEIEAELRKTSFGNMTEAGRLLGKVGSGISNVLSGGITDGSAGNIGSTRAPQSGLRIDRQALKDELAEIEQSVRSGFLTELSNRARANPQVPTETQPPVTQQTPQQAGLREAPLPPGQRNMPVSPEVARLQGAQFLGADTNTMLRGADGMTLVAPAQGDIAVAQMQNGVDKNGDEIAPRPVEMSAAAESALIVHVENMLYPVDLRDSKDKGQQQLAKAVLKEMGPVVIERAKDPRVLASYNATFPPAMQLPPDLGQASPEQWQSYLEYVKSMSTEGVGSGRGRAPNRSFREFFSGGAAS